MIRWGSFLKVKRVSKMVKEVDEIMKTYEEDGTSNLDSRRLITRKAGQH